MHHRARSAVVSAMSVKTLATLATLAVGLLAACDSLERVERRNDDGVLVERYSRDPVDSTRSGPYEAYGDDGELIEEATYVADRLHGERTLYHPNGAVQYVETYRDGQYHGPYLSYYPDGTLQLEGQYVDNVASGVWTGYYPSGERKEAVTFADNEENGPFTEWYSNGAIKAEGTYAGGDKEQGELLLYNLDGDVQKRMFCEAGICRTIWEASTAANDE